MKKLLNLISLGLLIVSLQGKLFAQTDQYDFGCIFIDKDTCDFSDAPNDLSIYDSRNGVALSPHGMIRMLVVFVELEYDDPTMDPSSDWNSNYWVSETLPIWADQLFSINTPIGISSKKVTNYFQYASSNDHIVLGDYLLAPDNGGVFKVKTYDGRIRDSLNIVIDTINNKLGTTIVTAGGLSSINAFDSWTPTSSGLVKDNIGNGKWDYVVFLIRNSLYPANHNGGNVTVKRPLLGHKVDQGCIICAGDTYNPTHVIRHEYAHSLLGGNNFHTCGGGWAKYHNYWIPQTGGWALLGLYNSSLMCWSAWDRYRLGWKSAGNAYDISARSSDGITEVNGDIDTNTGNGIYVLRDFVTTGDALRIKLPYINEENEYPEWIWLEYHQGVSNNNVEFDQWQYQRYSCVADFEPGLMAYIQINSNTRESHYSGVVFGQFADYLNPLTANGFWDRQFLTDSVYNGCVSDARIRPFIRVEENPLTGCGDQSFYAFDLDGNDSLYSDPDNKTKQDQLSNWTEKEGNTYYKKLFQLGHSSHSFNLNGNIKNMCSVRFRLVHALV